MSDTLDDLNTCQICHQPIKMACFRWRGVCCENHRKIRDGEIDKTTAIERGWINE